MNPKFSMACRKRQNCHKLAPFCFTTEFWEAWVQRQLWCLPRNKTCFAASHFTVVAVLCVKNLQLKYLWGVLQAFAATPQTRKWNSASLYSIEKFTAWRVNSTLNFTRKTDIDMPYRFFKWNLTWNSLVSQWIFLESHSLSHLSKTKHFLFLWAMPVSK